jgi:hypothetical protein
MLRPIHYIPCDVSTADRINRDFMSTPPQGCDEMTTLFYLDCDKTSPMRHSSSMFQAALFPCCDILSLCDVLPRFSSLPLFPYCNILSHCVIFSQRVTSDMKVAVQHPALQLLFLPILRLTVSLTFTLLTLSLYLCINSNIFFLKYMHCSVPLFYSFF